jgi:hypothetical protein
MMLIPRNEEKPMWVLFPERTTAVKKPWRFIIARQWRHGPNSNGIISDQQQSTESNDVQSM